MDKKDLLVRQPIMPASAAIRSKSTLCLENTQRPTVQAAATRRWYIKPARPVPDYSGSAQLGNRDNVPGFLRPVRRRTGHALHVLDRFHGAARMNKAADEARASAPRAVQKGGYQPALTKSA